MTWLMRTHIIVNERTCTREVDASPMPLPSASMCTTGSECETLIIALCVWYPNVSIVIDAWIRNTAVSGCAKLLLLKFAPLFVRRFRFGRQRCVWKWRRRRQRQPQRRR